MPRPSRKPNSRRKLSEKGKLLVLKRWENVNKDRPRPIDLENIIPQPESVTEQPPVTITVNQNPLQELEDPNVIASRPTSSQSVSSTPRHISATVNKFLMTKPKHTTENSEAPGPISNETKIDVDTGSEFFIIQRKSLHNLVKSFPCKGCFNTNLTIEVEERSGLACKFKVVCTDCHLVQSESCSSDRDLVSKDSNTPRSSRPAFLVNTQFAKAFSNFGKGYAAMERFAMEMNMKVASSSNYYNTMKAVHRDQLTTVTVSLNAARAEVRKAYIDADVSLVNEKYINVAVSYDGSWHKRGHTSMYGIACVIDTLTGLVIDYHVLSKYCHSCAINEKLLKGRNSVEFQNWFVTHKILCDKNYTGSSGAMEKDIAEILWRRSEQLCGMRYMTVLSDGDAKTLQHLNTLNVYGEGNYIDKEECLNHVAKRLGTGLRNQVKDWKSKGVTLSGKKYGSLTEEKIVKLQNYYRCAITKNIPHVEKMKTAIFATLQHEMSTDNDPRHEKCPDGEDSWCFYRRAVAKREVPPSHKKYLGTALSMEIIQKIMPVYQRLANDELLKRCLRGKTQNANESLHSIIWNKCGKDTFVGKQKICTAVAEGVSEFNQGCMTTANFKWSVFGVSPGENTTVICQKRDKRRIQQSVKRLQNAYKQARKQKKYCKTKEQKKQKEKEGPTYGAGQF